MPVTAAQVFGPVTVDPGFTTTGEKTLLTMNTTLPAGGKNVIMAVMMLPAALETVRSYRLGIKKGGTVLYSTVADYGGGGAANTTPFLVMAIDESPAGNDSYTFFINIITASSATAAVHVQGIVIKADDAVVASNTSTVTVNNGATSTVLSLSTTFSSGSKVVVVAGLAINTATSRATRYTISAGNVRLKRNANVVSSNEFGVKVAYPFGQGANNFVSLIWFETLTASNPTFSIEVANDSGTDVAVFGQILAFTVSDGAFLDTGSVSLTSGSQVTVGNLSTSLSGGVVAIAIAGAAYSSTVRTGFNANDVVHQKDNSSTGQIANLVDWYFSDVAFAGYLPMFRFDTSVTNPSYQVKMTARVTGLSGEAKIVAFSTVLVEEKTVTDSISLSDAASVSSSFVVSDSFSLTEAYSSEGHIPVSDYLTLTDVIESPKTVLVTDSISLTDAIGPNELKVSDSITLIEAVGILANIPAADSLSIADFAERAEPAREVADSIRLTDSVFIERNVQRIETSRRVLAPKRILPAERSTSPR